MQNQIKREKEHWRNVLLRLIAIVKYLGKYTLAFRGKNWKIYQENNGNFNGLITMMAEFDPLMEKHVRGIKNKEVRYHYLSHSIQNEFILMLASEIKCNR